MIIKIYQEETPIEGKILEVFSMIFKNDLPSPEFIKELIELVEKYR